MSDRAKCQCLTLYKEQRGIRCAAVFDKNKSYLRKPALWQLLSERSASGDAVVKPRGKNSAETND
jgi:hypothetical protein